MAKNSTNVNVFADANYAVWTALAGTTVPTTLPPTNPGAGYYEVGLLSDNGITESHNFNETKIYDLAGSLVRIARNQEERPWTFECMEGSNVVDSLRFPGSSLTSAGGTAEVQTITISGTATGGTFQPLLAGYGTVAAQVYNVTTSALATALSNAWGFPVTVTGTPATSYVVTFPVAAGNVSQMTVNSNLTGTGSPAATVATTTPGVTGINTRNVGSGLAQNRRQWAIDLVDGNYHKRILINNGEAIWTGTTNYNGTAAAIYQFTLQPYKDANGNYYTVIDDGAADAESFA